MITFKKKLRTFLWKTEINKKLINASDYHSATVVYKIHNIIHKS